jgi:hypothetical protein
VARAGSGGAEIAAAGSTKAAPGRFGRRYARSAAVDMGASPVANRDRWLSLRHSPYYWQYSASSTGRTGAASMASSPLRGGGVITVGALHGLLSSSDIECLPPLCCLRRGVAKAALPERRTAEMAPRHVQHTSSIAAIG